MKAATGPHNLSSEKNRDETPSEPTIQSSQDLDDECARDSDSATVCPDSPTCDDPELEVCYNVPSVWRALTGSNSFVQEGDEFEDIAKYMYQVSPIHPFLSPESLNIRVVVCRTSKQNPC